jgi:hypothetical protein
MDTGMQPWWRKAAPILKTGAMGLLVVFNTACVGSPVEEQAEKVSLVEAWNMKMTRKDADHVAIAFSPMLSTMYARPGANFKSDGKTLWVSLPKCKLQTDCPVMVPSELHKTEGQSRWYEVVVPYKGERVMVSGEGPVEEELVLTTP